MKTTKKIITACATVLFLTAACFQAFAASPSKTPVEPGKLDEYKADILKLKKEALDALVAEGKLTREQADAIYSELESNQASCDGSGSAAIGRNAGVRFGSAGCGQGVCGTDRGNGAGCGQGVCGAGRGNGAGRGQGCALQADCIYR